MDKSQATTRVILTLILKNYLEAAQKYPENTVSITEQTIDAIQDNSHNIHPRQTN